MTPLQEEICREALAVYGIGRQIDKAKEELSELHLELDRLTSSPEKTCPKNIVTEIADVIIMMKQLEIIYGGAVQREVENKLMRLKQRMAEE